MCKIKKYIYFLLSSYIYPEDGGSSFLRAVFKNTVIVVINKSESK
jgi:hypothetical protein